MVNAAAALECPKSAVDTSRERLATLLPRPNGIEDGSGRKGEGARLNICKACGWSKPKGVEPTCAHAARGPVTLLSPPHRRTKPVVPDIEGHDSAASAMLWWTRRWPERQFEPEESDNIRQARDQALADAIRASGASRIKSWGRHSDPVKGLPACGAILDAQPDSAGVWAWMRQNGIAWDDSERKGAIPAGRRSNADAGNATDGELVDPAKLLHRKWRQHVDAPETTAGYTFLRRWARDRAERLDRVLDDHVKQDGTLREAPAIYSLGRHRDARLTKDRRPKAKKWPRFSPTMLSPEARVKWEHDNNLDWVLGRHRLNLETYARGDQLDHEGRDGGWARHVGVRPADKLLARKRALERVEDEVDAYLEHGRDLATARALDVDKMVETADAVAYATESPEATIKIIRQFLTPDEPWEATLRRVAREGTPVTVEFARGLLAEFLEPLREPLRPWSESRTGRGIGYPDDGGVLLDIGGFYFKEPPAGRGRPRDHDPALVRMALLRADAIQRRLGVRALVGLAGGLPEPIRASEVGVALYFAASIQPNAPTLFQAVVLAGLLAAKRRPSPRKLARAAAAQMAGLPVEALAALERATAG